MQTWAKRGIQTALVTGGLLMLGTGIASADEDVNPDKPAPPLDGSLLIPFHIDNNVIGGPFGPIEAPSVNHEVEVGPDIGNTAAVLSDALDDVIGYCAPECGSAESPIAGDPFRGNRLGGDVIIPVDVSGNAIGLFGDAEVCNDSSQSIEANRPVVTEGHDFLAGNIIDLDWALPVQITNNAISGLGSAEACGTSEQHAAAVGDLQSDGTGGTLAGNIIAAQWATPVQANGNAVSGLGTAEATSDGSTDAEAGGWILTDGDNSFGSGNVGAVPAAVPFEANGNAVGAGALTSAQSTSEATATAGDTRVGPWDRQTYVQTSGDPAALAGNVTQPSASGPVSAMCNAGSVVATSDASCTSGSAAKAGGTTQTDGSGSVASGSVANPAVALPGQASANAATAGGDATATQNNTVSSDSGGDNFTHAPNSTASGTEVAPTASTPTDVASNAAAGVGTATTNATNDSTSDSGGFNGTSGPNSLASGNSVPVPVATPAEGFGNVAGAAGTAASSTTETKESTSGGDSSTDDPGGFGAANLASGAVAGAAQVAGNGAGALGDTTSSVNMDNKMRAGGNNKATGTNGTAAGNMVPLATSAPVQVFGSNGTAGGDGEADVVSQTDSTAGGDAVTDGSGGLGTGNVVGVPTGSAGQLFAESAAVLGRSSGTAQNATGSTAGGDLTTSGENGTAAGNAVTAQAMPIVQSFAASVAGAGGLDDADGTSDTAVDSGGDISTNGDCGTFSGNLVDAPAGGAVQPFGDAVSAIGSSANSTGNGTTAGTAGGTSTTTGNGGSLSGVDVTLPLGANLPIYGVPAEVLAEAIAHASHFSEYSWGEQDAVLDFPFTGSTVDGLAITKMPRLREMSEQSRSTMPLPALGQVTGLLGGLPAVGGLTGGELTGGIPLAGGLAGGLPVAGGLGGLPAAGDLTGGLPGAGNLTGGVPGAGNLTGGVPGAGMAGAVPDFAGGFAGQLPGAPRLPELPATDTFPAPAPRVGAPALPVPALEQLGGVEELTSLVGSLFDDGLSDALDADLPEVSSVPGLQHVPGVPAVPVHTPALSGLDTATLLNSDGATESPTLADTRSKLAGLFSHNRIG